jgi:hypothetical protein
MTEQVTAPAQPGVPEEDFGPYLELLAELCGYVNMASQLAGPLTPDQAARLGDPVRGMLSAAASLADMARAKGAMIILDPESCEICGTVDQAEFRHLTAEHYGPDVRMPADQVADALRELFDRILGLVMVKNRKTAEALLLNLMDLAQDSLAPEARDGVVSEVLGRKPYPDCCTYHATGGRNPAYAHHERQYAADGQS